MVFFSEKQDDQIAHGDSKTWYYQRVGVMKNINGL